MRRSYWTLAIVPALLTACQSLLGLDDYSGSDVATTTTGTMTGAGGMTSTGVGGMATGTSVGGATSSAGGGPDVPLDTGVCTSNTPVNAGTCGSPKTMDILCIVAPRLGDNVRAKSALSNDLRFEIGLEVTGTALVPDRWFDPNSVGTVARTATAGQSVFLLGFAPDDPWLQAPEPRLELGYNRPETQVFLTDRDGTAPTGDFAVGWVSGPGDHTVVQGDSFSEAGFILEIDTGHVDVVGHSGTNTTDQVVLYDWVQGASAAADWLVVGAKPGNASLSLPDETLTSMDDNRSFALHKNVGWSYEPFSPDMLRAKAAAVAEQALYVSLESDTEDGLIVAADGGPPLVMVTASEPVTMNDLDARGAWLIQAGAVHGSTGTLLFAASSETRTAPSAFVLGINVSDQAKRFSAGVDGDPKNTMVSIQGAKGSVFGAGACYGMATIVTHPDGGAAPSSCEVDCGATGSAFLLELDDKGAFVAFSLIPVTGLADPRPTAFGSDDKDLFIAGYGSAGQRQHGWIARLKFP